MTLILPRGTSAIVERSLTPEPEKPLPTDPVEWIQNELKEHLWSKQREVARSVITNRRTMVPAAHGVGKSFLAARMAAYWIASHPVGEAFVVTSAPSGAQVKAILWRELAKAHRRADLPGRLIGLSGSAIPEWHVGPPGEEQLVAFGRKPQDMKSPEEAMQAFQGIHARYVLVILDEATGIPPWLWAAADSLLTNEAARILAIGNPDDASSYFASECKPGSGSTVIPISALDSPAFTGERIPEHLKEMLVTKTWVEERAKKWGTDNPMYQSKVLAQFPDDSDRNVITPRMIRAACDLDLPGDTPGAYGLDVARFGADSTTLYRMRGGVAREVDSWAKKDTVETADMVQALVNPAVPIAVDADGLGAGVFDQLRRRGFKTIPFTAAGKIHEPRRFNTRRSEIWWGIREMFEEGLIDIDPEDEDLAAQLQQSRWSVDGRGRICVETKDEMAKRGLGSPDRADALIMAEHGSRRPVFTAPEPEPGRTVKKAESAGVRHMPL